MTLRIVLMKGNKVLAEVPLPTKDEPNRQIIEREIDDFKPDEFKELSDLFDALSNEDRLKMLSKMYTTDGPVRFVDFMNDLDLNQKLVSDYCRRMMNSGLVTCREKGKYEASSLGSNSFLFLAVAFRKIMKELEDEME